MEFKLSGEYSRTNTKAESFNSIPHIFSHMKNFGEKFCQKNFKKFLRNFFCVWNQFRSALIFNGLMITVKKKKTLTIFGTSGTFKSFFRLNQYDLTVPIKDNPIKSVKGVRKTMKSLIVNTLYS